MPFFPKNILGSERERLQSSKSGFILISALIIEQPIPEDPPVIMTTEKRLKYSKCLVDVFEFGIFLLCYIEAVGLIRTIKRNQ